MHIDTQVTLRTTKPNTLDAPSRPPVILGYRPRPCPAKQTRFADRTALAPDIDLGAYVCRAVIDWVQIRVHLKRPTQFQWIQRDVLAATGIKVFTSNDDADAPNAADDIFHLRFQEPTGAFLAKAITAINAKFGIDGEPIVEMLEVSVDFTPKNASFEDRSRMFGVLVRHLHPSRDVLTCPRDRPRFSWGRGKEQAHVLERNGRDSQLNPGLFASAGNDRPVPVDTTYYLGATDGPAAWRVQSKEGDQRNCLAETYLDLPENKRRARVEVTLNSDELLRLGITTINDLHRFNFTKLQRGYFQFALPTFQHSFTSMIAAREWLSNRRRSKFLDAGVVGLAAMDAATARRRRAARRSVVASLASMGLRAEPLRREGTGRAATFASYEELNKRVQTALRHLRESMAVRLRDRAT
jgi:hypothetical protein